jgi:hypothetical protein
LILDQKMSLRPGEASFFPKRRKQAKQKPECAKKSRDRYCWFDRAPGRDGGSFVTGTQNLLDTILPFCYIINPERNHKISPIATWANCAILRFLY